MFTAMQVVRGADDQTLRVDVGASGIQVVLSNGPEFGTSLVRWCVTGYPKDFISAAESVLTNSESQQVDFYHTGGWLKGGFMRQSHNSEFIDLQMIQVTESHPIREIIIGISLRASELQKLIHIIGDYWIQD